MITCNLMGGLGNQLFQIFTTISHSMISKNPFKFTDSKTLGQGSTTIRNTYWDSFLLKLKPFLCSNFPQMIVIREDNFVDYKIQAGFLKDKDIMFFGYFQSYKYFENEYDTIVRLLDVNNFKSKLISKLNFDKTNTISMHFRLGDYKSLQDYHPIMPYKYYENALNYILQKLPSTNVNVIYFCEDADIDDVNIKIKNLSTTFNKVTFIRGNNELADWEQMLLMSLCEHNIIANSSFSWWAAYLNSNSEKIVCYPSLWYGERANIDTSFMFPDSWIKIDT